MPPEQHIPRILLVEDSPTDRAPVEILVFQVESQRHGLVASAVQEVLPAVTVAPLPGAPAAVEGVLDLRGRLVPVLDIRVRLGLSPKAVEHTDHLVITRAGERLLAIRVDRATELGRVAAVAAADTRGVEPGVPPTAGMVRLPGGLTFIHDPRTFLSPAEWAALAAACGFAEAP